MNLADVISIQESTLIKNWHFASSRVWPRHKWWLRCLRELPALAKWEDLSRKSVFSVISFAVVTNDSQISVVSKHKTFFLTYISCEPWVSHSSASTYLYFESRLKEKTLFGTGHSHGKGNIRGSVKHTTTFMILLRCSTCHNFLHSIGESKLWLSLTLDWGSIYHQHRRPVSHIQVGVVFSTLLIQKGMNIWER